MAIDLDIAYVDGEPTTIINSKNVHPMAKMKNYDEHYDVIVVKRHAYPLNDPFDCPDDIDYSDYKKSLFQTLYRHCIREKGVGICIDDMSFIYCPEEKLVIVRVRLNVKETLYVGLLHDGRFINNYLNRNTLGEIYFQKEENL